MNLITNLFTLLPPCVTPTPRIPGGLLRWTVPSLVSPRGLKPRGKTESQRSKTTQKHRRPVKKLLVNKPNLLIDRCGRRKRWGTGYD